MLGFFSLFLWNVIQNIEKRKKKGHGNICSRYEKVVLYVQEVVTQPKILNGTILSNKIHVTKAILLCKRLIFNLNYKNKKKSV